MFGHVYLRFENGDCNKLASVHRRYPPWSATVYIRAMSLALTIRRHFRRKVWTHEKNWNFIITVWRIGFHNFKYYGTSSPSLEIILGIFIRMSTRLPTHCSSNRRWRTLNSKYVSRSCDWYGSQHVKSSCRRLSRCTLLGRSVLTITSNDSNLDFYLWSFSTMCN